MYAAKIRAKLLILKRTNKLFQASERHVLRVMWVAIVAVAALASLMALTVNSIYGLL